MPDIWVSQRRFESLACLPRVFPTWRGLSAGTHAPRLPRFTHGLVPSQRFGVIPAQCPAPHCIDENRQMPRVPLPSVGIALAGGCKLHPCEDVTPRSSLIRTHSPIPFASSCLRLLASYKKSSQVATSPCCQRDLPDVISANPSSDAWSLATAVPRSAFTCFFLRVIGLPHEMSGSASRNSPRIRLLTVAIFDAADISLCSGLRVCSSPRSFLPLLMFRRAAGTFTSGLNVRRYLRTHRIC